MSNTECLSLFSFNIWRPHPHDLTRLSVYGYKGMKQLSIDISKSNQNWLDTKIRQRYDRPKAIQSMLSLYKDKVDIFAFQELTLPSYKIIEQSLGNSFKSIHHCASSKEKHGFPSDIFWDKNKYELMCYDYKTKDHDGAPLLWCFVRLSSKKTNQIINILSVHFHCCFYEPEILNGLSPRIDDMKTIIAVINKYVQRNEPVFIVGDFNDFFIPAQYFSSSKQLEDGYSNAFGDVGERAPVTCPTPAAYFYGNVSDGQAMVTYDWQFFKKKGKNINVDTLSAKVVKFHDMGIYPSDHYPLHAIYRIRYGAQSKL